MRKLSPLIAIWLCLLLFTPLVALAVSQTFTDTAGHWAEDTIELFSHEEVISGFPDGSFRPNQDVTRAELTRVVHFTWLVTHLDILEGDPSGYFRPAWDVSRVEVLTIIDAVR